MLTVNDISLHFSDKKLFDDINLQFLPGNCYGIIGANGAGKSTFLKILSGEVDPSSGHVSLEKDKRLAFLRQDQNAYDDFTVLETVMMGYEELFQLMKDKDAIYLKDPFTEEDGMKAAEMEELFGEMDGWSAESDAAILLEGLGVGTDLHYSQMSTLKAGDKVKVLLAQALFGNPDVLLLDEPTNNLDISAIHWLENFIMDFPNTVIVVSHDRHFLNKVCTHTIDIDFQKATQFVGNYDFWYESSQLAQHMQSDLNKKKEDKIKELQAFVAHFSANASKSRQATSRKKMLEKITLDDIKPSSRRYPYIHFDMDRELGKEVLKVNNVSHSIDGVKVLNDVSFEVFKDDMVGFLGENDISVTTLFQILSGEIEPDEGEVAWGMTSSQSYLPKDNNRYFEGSDKSLLDWLMQFSAEDEAESYLRGFLGRMLFSGDEVLKKVPVLSGGEKMRCMFSKMMLQNSNVLILDDPTNHLDLESITALNNGLIEFKGSILFSSHDIEFIDSLANRLIKIDEKGNAEKHDMTYTEYLEKTGQNF